MVQEAETEHARILEDAVVQQQQAEQMLQEAEAQVELMAQEAQAEAERIISEANMEAARIIEAAEQSHQEIVEAATQDGFNVGYQEGREEAIKENAQLLMETTNALNKLHAAFPVAVKQNEDKLIKLALEISREVIQDELMMKPEIVLKNVERAIGKVSDLEKVLIRVNPLDLDLVLPKQEYFRKLLPDVQDFIITGHYSIERGGCHIETNSGTIDAQINTQLAVVEEVFQQIRSEYDFDEEEAMDEEDEI
jgi:flagellar assembly protein FliH